MAEAESKASPMPPPAEAPSPEPATDVTDDIFMLHGDSNTQSSLPEYELMIEPVEPILHSRSSTPATNKESRNTLHLPSTATDIPSTDGNITNTNTNTFNNRNEIYGSRSRVLRRSPLTPQISASPSQKLCAEILSKAMAASANGSCSRLNASTTCSSACRSPRLLALRWPLFSFGGGLKGAVNSDRGKLAGDKKQPGQLLLGIGGREDREESEEEFMFVRTVPCTTNTFSRSQSSETLNGLRTSGGSSTTLSPSLASPSSSTLLETGVFAKISSPLGFWRQQFWGKSLEAGGGKTLQSADAVDGQTLGRDIDDYNDASEDKSSEEAAAFRPLLPSSAAMEIHSSCCHPGSFGAASSAWKKIATCFLIWASMVSLLVGIVLLIFSMKSLDHWKVHGFLNMRANRTVFEMDMLLSAYNPNIRTIHIGDYSSQRSSTNSAHNERAGKVARRDDDDDNDDDDDDDNDGGNGRNLPIETDINLHLFVQQQQQRRSHLQVPSRRGRGSGSRGGRIGEFSVGSVQKFYQNDLHSNGSSLARLIFLPLTTSMMEIRVIIADPAQASLSVINNEEPFILVLRGFVGYSTLGFKKSIKVCSRQVFPGIRRNTGTRGRLQPRNGLNMANSC